MGAFLCVPEVPILLAHFYRVHFVLSRQSYAFVLLILFVLLLYFLNDNFVISGRLIEVDFLTLVLYSYIYIYSVDIRYTKQSDPLRYSVKVTPTFIVLAS